MTYIAKPSIDDSEVLNHIARDLVIANGTDVKLKRGMRIATTDGVVHEVSFAQLDGLLNILDTTRDIPSVTPLQYLVQHYDLKDLVKLGMEGWAIPSYRAVLMADTKTIRLDGLLTREGYVDKEFTFALGGFDFIQQLSFARCIAGLSPQLEQVIGTFDLNYSFTSGPDGVTVSTDIGV